MYVLVSIVKGRLIEMQSYGDAETLLRNAISAGFDPGEVEIKEINEDEYLALLESQMSSPSLPSIEERLEATESALLTLLEGV